MFTTKNHDMLVCILTFHCKANPKLADLRDDDDRLPIHWAVSFNHLSIAEILAQTKTFDPDVQVCSEFLNAEEKSLTKCKGWIRVDPSHDGS
jgi:hypothetical protein